MSGANRNAGFTLIELLVAVTITLVLATIMVTVTVGTLNVWRRSQDDFSASTQAKLVLDYLERDFQSAVFRRDGQAWLAVDVINTVGNLAIHGWMTAATMKPATTESQRCLPAALNGIMPTIADARFGLSGAWLRFIATNIDSNGSVPIAVSYQVARRPVSGSVSAANPAEVRYSLFRSAVATDSTFATGYDVLAAGYGSSSSSPLGTRAAGTLTNPNNADVIATNVVDFGVWLYSRNSSGVLTQIYPTSSSDTSHVGNSSASFPAVADVMVRILTEEGAKIVDGIEKGNGAVSRPPGYAMDAEWWWAVVEANSRVVVRRIEVKGATL